MEYLYGLLVLFLLTPMFCTRKYHCEFLKEIGMYWMNPMYCEENTKSTPNNQRSSRHHQLLLHLHNSPLVKERDLQLQHLYQKRNQASKRNVYNTRR